MLIPRFRLALGLLIVLMVALDIAAVQYAFRPWSANQPIRVALLNALPMGNILLLMAYALTRRGRTRRPFVAGFFGGGLLALLIQVVLDTAFSQLTWKLYDWELEVSMKVVQTTSQRLTQTGLVDLSQVPLVTNGYIAYFPIMILVFAAPQFLLALGGGLIWPRIRGRSSDRWAAAIRPEDDRTA